ncbi:MAG: thiamine-monophosphate kinase [Gammaproteobacteria bacterium]|jgi:thiamine-monophosphate kinase
MNAESLLSGILPGTRSAAQLGTLFGETPSPQHDQQLVLSVDSLVDNVHFNANSPLDALGYKCVAVNLSDMAAMGATPLAMHCAWGDPHDDPSWHDPVLAAIAQAAESLAVPVTFGQLSTVQRQITIQIMGTVPHGQALTRAGAHSGDQLWVSGTLGDAGAGLALQQGDLRASTAKDCNYLLARLNRPTARLELGQTLRGIATAAIDISDGITGDATHIAEQSQVGLRLFAHRLPLSDALVRVVGRSRAQRLALSAGEDYELAFCAPANQEAQVRNAARRCQIPVHCVGDVVDGDAVLVLDENAHPLDIPSAFDHFVDDSDCRETES